MVPLAQLWLPILVSTVAVFVASSIVHMVLPHHRSDYRATEDEDAVMDVLRRAAPARAQYMVPHAATPKAMSAPEYQEKVQRGPSALVVILPAGGGMGRALGMWLAYVLLASVLVAFVAGSALVPGAEYLRVFRLAGATALGVYALGIWQEAIWFGRPAAVTLKGTLDGVLYALLTAGVFGWLWP